MNPFIVAAVIVFVGILIFVHEMGHFVVAKAFGVKVLKFSLGFGPPLLAFTWGETTYQIALIPLGGYVRMAGEHYDDSLSDADKARSFLSAPIYQRALISIAGPAANLIFPIICFFAYNLLEPEVLSPVVGQVEFGGPAYRAGMLPGDRILSVDGHRTWSFERVQHLIRARPDQTFPVRIQRGDKVLELVLTPKAIGAEDVFGHPKKNGVISVSQSPDGTEIGIDDIRRLPKSANGDTFRTGDKVLAVAGVQVQRGDALASAFARVAGQEIVVKVARPHPTTAGDVLATVDSQIIDLRVRISTAAHTLEDIGLALGAPFVRTVVEGGAAAQAGIRAGDRIVSVNGRPVQHFWRFQTELLDARAASVQVKVRRLGVEHDLTLTLEPVECRHVVTRKLTTAYDSGFGLGAAAESGMECTDLNRPFASWGAHLPPALEPARLSIDEALVDSFRLTSQVTGLIARGLFKVLTREVSTDTVGGPLQFMNFAVQAAEQGMLAYLRWLAFISINLGVFNLLPVPVLDGGHLLLCLVEAVKRKPLSPEARERATLIGLAFLAVLLVLALRNDLRSFELF